MDIQHIYFWKETVFFLYIKGYLIEDADSKMLLLLKILD